jgi:general secretion pathway protein D
VTKSGIPSLHRLPVIGSLFGQTTNDHRRTELVVLITPRAVRDSAEARSITEEFRSKMQSLRPLTDSLKPAHTDDAADAPAKDHENPAAHRSVPARPAGMPGRAAAPDVSPSYARGFQTPGR